jgi:hypothetical protein
MPLPYEPTSTFAYLPVQATTRDGRDVEGHRVNEDSFTIQIRDEEGRVVSLRKGELQRLAKRYGSSAMPSYKDGLTASEVDDLVAYLASLRGEP